MSDSPVPGDNEGAATPWLARLKRGLAATRAKLGAQLTSAFARSQKLDPETIEALETTLLSADVGVAATQYLIDALRTRARESAEQPPVDLLRGALTELLRPLERPFAMGTARPYVIMLAGVNGAGKTTSIGKLAKRLREQGHSVLLAAGDTFRAAAE